MAARTLEDKLDRTLEHVELGCKMQRLRIDNVTPAERIAWMRSMLEDAAAIQARIEKRDKRKTAVSA